MEFLAMVVVMITALFSVDNTLNEVCFSLTKGEAKAARKGMRSVKGHEAHKNRCAKVCAARLARKDVMSHVSSANRMAEAKAKACSFMTGKSWQQAIAIKGSNSGVKAAKRAKLLASKNTIRKGGSSKAVPKVYGNVIVMSKRKSIAQLDAEWKAARGPVKDMSKRTAPTWSMYQKVVVLKHRPADNAPSLKAIGAVLELLKVAA